MSQKNDKKLRQMFRHDIKHRLQDLTDDYFGGDAPVFNKKPKYCPMWFWNFLTNLIVDNGFLIQYKLRQKNVTIEVDENTDDTTEQKELGDDR